MIPLADLDGPELDREVAEALELEPRYVWNTGVEPPRGWDDPLAMKERPIDDAPLITGNVNCFLVEVHRPYSTDPAACAVAKRAALEKGLGWVVVVYFKGSFGGYMSEVDYPPFDSEGLVTIFPSTESADVHIADTEERAVALSIVAAARARS